MAMRVRLRRTMTGVWLHQDVPITLDVTRGLTGRNKVTGTVPPAFDVTAEDHLPMWLERGTTAYLEDESGDIVFCGPCTYSAPSRAGRRVEFGGLLSLYDLIAYDWFVSAWQPDPFAIVQHLVDIGNAQPVGSLACDVIVDGVAPGYLGDEFPPARPAKPARDPGESRDDYQDRVFAWQEAVDDWEATYGAREPYTLAWYEHKYIGDEIRDLATTVPFDISDEFTGSSGGVGADPEHRLRVSPAAGTFRDDLALIQGMNLIGDLAPATQSNLFGNDIWVLGAGEGAAMRRGRATVADTRVRTTRFFEDKANANQAALDAKAAIGLTAATAPMQLESASARAGSLPELLPGDSLPVQSDLFEGTVRVIEITQSTAGGPIGLRFDTGGDT